MSDTIQLIGWFGLTCDNPNLQWKCHREFILTEYSYQRQDINLVSEQTYLTANVSLWEYIYDKFFGSARCGFVQGLTFDLFVRNLLTEKSNEFWHVQIWIRFNLYNMDKHQISTSMKQHQHPGPYVKRRYALSKLAWEICSTSSASN